MSVASTASWLVILFACNEREYKVYMLFIIQIMTAGKQCGTVSVRYVCIYSINVQRNELSDCCF